ncbi:MAG: hypothetical protein HQM16_08295 [Deltaproteobacteria bacterium]|nr:hypothetical protein [Deltaproteobacteria bacterium]
MKNRLNDAFIVSRYTGFLTISAVTVFELALKTIFCDFATRKNKVLGTFCEKYFEKINGKIKFKDIKENYLPKFGSKYTKRFASKIDKIELFELKKNGISVKASYGNIVTWRHNFAHQGILPDNASYSEAKRGYESGKIIMECLSECMRH